MKYYMALSTKSVSVVLIDGHILYFIKCSVYQKAGGLVQKSGDQQETIIVTTQSLQSSDVSFFISQTRRARLSLKESAQFKD